MRMYRGCILVFLGWSVATAAQAECANEFVKQVAPDGTTVYATFANHPELDPHKTIERLALVASERKLLVVKPPSDDGTEVKMVVGSVTPPMYPLEMAARDNGQVSMMLIASAQSGISADQARDQLCGMLAQLQSPSGSQTTASTTPAGSPAAGPITDPARTALPDRRAAPQVNVLKPSEIFDVGLAQQALEPGNSTIKGTACGSFMGQKVYPSTVWLVPGTPYMRELMRLVDDAKPGRDRVEGSPIAMTVRMEARMDPSAPGHFQFSRMKPGIYYVLAPLDAQATMAYEEQVGRVANSYDSANVYQQKYYTASADDALKQMVEIRQDGDVVDVKMRPPVRLFSGNVIRNTPLRSCM